MGITIHAVCGCNTGKVRRKNEDNFFFAGKHLERDNNGLDELICFEKPMRSGTYAAVFDGMGGENFGEYAAYAAVAEMKKIRRTIAEWFMPHENYLQKVVQRLNDAVIQVQEQMCTSYMGTTLVGLCFWGKNAYVYNVGDSRAYLLRNNELLQLSEDHVEKRPNRAGGKAPLTQYLGFGTEEIQIEPHIAAETIRRGDVYLLCSDGLTDMLSESEILDIMATSWDSEACVRNLIRAALDCGGRDNITVIVCALK